ncbi:MAG: tetratricopeptide repeat protein, partial [Cyanobacteriota bacterium]
MAGRFLSRRFSGLLSAPLALTLALPVGALDRLPPSPVGERRLAQAASIVEEELPAEVEGWADAAQAAYEKGEPAVALQLQLQVVAWVNSRLGPLDPLRPQALIKLGVLLSAVGRPQEALAPTEEAVKIRRELAKNYQAFHTDLANI